MQVEVTSRRSSGLNVPLDPQRVAGPWLCTLAPGETWRGDIGPALLAWLEAQAGVDVTRCVAEPAPEPVKPEVRTKPARASRTKGGGR